MPFTICKLYHSCVYLKKTDGVGGGVAARGFQSTVATEEAPECLSSHRYGEWTHREIPSKRNPETSWVTYTH